MQRLLESVAALSSLGLIAACTSEAPDPQAPELQVPDPSAILLYCDAQSDKPVTLTSDEDGSEFEATLSYRGFYRIDLEAEMLETQFAGNDKFASLCSTDGQCKLVSNKSEIRFENHGRRWEDKVIDETYVFERNTGHFYRKSEVKGPSETKIEYASGSCKPAASIDQQIF